MPRRLLAVVAVVLAALLAWSLGPDSDSVVGLEGGVESDTPATVVAESNATELVAGSGGVERSIAPIGLETDADTAQVGDTTIEPATVRGTVLLHDGRAASDARVTVWGGFENAAGERERWKMPAADVRPDGGFEFRFSPPAGLRLMLGADLPRGPGSTFAFESVAPGAVIDVGTISFPATGTIEGRVVRSDGTVVVAPWRGRAQSGWRPAGSEFAAPPVFARADEDTGIFVLRGVVAGSVEVTVDWEHGPYLFDESKTVDVRPDETTRVDFVFDGPNPLTTLQLLLHVDDPRWATAPGPESVTLFDFAGAAIPPDRILVQGSYFQFTDLEAAPHRLVIDDVHFERVELFELLPGTGESIDLVGSAVVVLNGVDGTSGAPITDIAVWSHQLEPVGDRVRRDSIELQGHEPSGAPFYRVAPVPQRWTLQATGFEEAEVEFVGGPAPRSRTEVDVVFERALAITGRLVDASGQPLADQRVRARRSPAGPTDEWDANAWATYRREAGKSTDATADADGRFVLAPLEVGLYDLAAQSPTDGAPALFDVAAGTEGIELRVAALGSIEGRFDPLFPAIERVTASLRRPDGDADRVQRLARLARRPREITVDAAGRFRADGLPEGAYELLVEPPPVFLPGIGSSSKSAALGPKPDPIAIDVRAGEVTRVTVPGGAWTPSVARVTVTRDGRPEPGLVVHGFLVGESEFEMNDRIHLQTAAIGITGGDGLAEVVPIQVGRWTFQVRPVNQQWSVPLAGEYAVEAGQELELSLDLTLATARVEFTDESGAPLANHHLRIGTPLFERSVTADGDGAVTLTFPPGSVEVLGARPPGSFGGEWAFGAATLQWTANGPIEERVALPRLDGR